MTYTTVPLTSNTTWFDLVDYRVWLYECVGCNVAEDRSWWLDTVGGNYSIVFVNEEDATAFKLVFNIHG